MSCRARRRPLAVASLALGLAVATPALAQDGLDLRTATPDEGFTLAVELARKSVTTVQPDPEVVNELRSAYARDPGLLIESTSVVAEFFATVAAANDYWREE